MKIQPECIPCLMKRCLFEINLSRKDRETSKKAIINAMKTLLKEFDPNKCSALIATEVHRSVYETLKTDPYKDMKERSNKVALSLLPHIEKIIEKSSDPLESTALCSVICNILDFGIEGGSMEPEKFNKDFYKFYNEGFGYTDYREFKEILSKSENVLFFTDNCGEVVFDKLFCREIKKFNPKVRLIIVVKGEPILSDATREDVERLNFREVVDGILDTGTFAVGFDPEKLPEDLKREMNMSDLIISKGMANYEVFSELNYRPIVYLLRTKCDPVSRSIGLEKNINVLKIFA